MQVEFGSNLANYLLNFCVNNPKIDCVIIGVNNAEQLISNVSSISKDFQLPILNNYISNNILIPANWPKN